MASGVMKFERGGKTFCWENDDDYGFGHPWKEHDGHGIVRYVRAINLQVAAKKPGEVLIYRDNHDFYFYDVKASTELAKKDGWGLGDKRLADLKAKLQAEPTKAQIIAEAVRLDMLFCSEFLAGDINWMRVSCWIEGEFGQRLYEQGTGGILAPYDDPCLLETAHELADQTLQELAQLEAELDLHMAGL